MEEKDDKSKKAQAINKLLFGKKKLSINTFSPDNKVVLKTLGMVECDTLPGERPYPNGR